MLEDQPSPELRHLGETAAKVAQAVLRVECELVDREAVWPERGLRALAHAGLMGLHVPRHLGGLGEGLSALVAITEEIGKVCGSTGMCFAMHCVASKVLAVKATAEQENRYLRPIAEGKHLTTLALSEPGTGANFFLPRTRFHAEGDRFIIDGQKSFVTNGGHADSYVISAVPPGAELDPGTFTCLAVDAAGPGIAWLEPWNGFGMRGNSSRTLRFEGAAVPATNLLGAEGDQIWYLFEVIAPYFLGAMAGVYVGIAQAALDAAVAHLRERRHAHTGEPLSAIPVLSHEIAEMSMTVQRSRQLVHYAARLVDSGSSAASQALFAAKIDVAEAVVNVTNAAMRLTGGRAYQENSTLGRLLRDAQAAHVMAPTTHLLKNWLGRSVLGLPLL